MGEFKVGDRVRTYSFSSIWNGPYTWVGEVIEIKDDCLMVRDEERSSYWAHSKQCRKLVKKKSEAKLNDPANALKCMKMIKEFNNRNKE